MMTGPPISIHIDPATKLAAVHILGIFCSYAVLGVIKKVEPNTPTTWCHRVREEDRH